MSKRIQIVRQSAEYGMEGVEYELEDAAADILIRDGWAKLADNQAVYAHQDEIPAEAVEAAPEAALEAEAAEVSATKGALDHAAELGVDISQVQGTGKDGKVTKGDVAAAAAQEGASDGG